MKVNMKFAVVVFLTLLYFTEAQDDEFPADFEFGVATASYQIEGAWNVGGKGVNIWDHLTHNQPHLIADRSNGDDACLAYYKNAEDVQLLVDLEVDFYRFSISWSRILPTGHVNKINQEGIDYYNDLIDRLEGAGIKPFVTMFHWDLPQPLQEIGGWPNPLLADIFVDYANVLYREFGDRVKNWITFNEPTQICEQGYSASDKAPAYSQAGIGGYLCAHTVLIAHAKTYRLYYDEYFEEQGGRVGITIDTGMSVPADPESEEDKDAAEQALQMNYGWYANPIFSAEGDYPEILKIRVEQMSKEEGFPTSRLPSFTPEEIDLIRGSSDFLGLNHYSSGLCTFMSDVSDIPRPSHYADVGVWCYPSPNWEGSASSWLNVYAEGLRLLLIWMKEHYQDPEIIITENGYSDRGNLDDCRRANYYNAYLEEVLKAIKENQVRVTGYTAWSFMDNFEWRQGYTERFGIHHVDFTDPDRPRTPKLSSYVYRNIIRSRKVDWYYQVPGFRDCDWNDWEVTEAPDVESNEV